MERRALKLEGRRRSVVIALLVALLLVCEDGLAAMYACRTASGGYTYTNVRRGKGCRALSFKGNIVTMRFKYNRRNAKKYDSTINRIAARHGVDPSLIKAIIHIESGFNNRAVSRRGAKGLMQLMPGTARDLNVYNPFNAQQNIDAGTRYFRQILDDFNGNIQLSLAAYNAGPNLVSRLQRVPAIPETRAYVRKVMRMYRIYKRKSR